MKFLFNCISVLFDNKELALRLRSCQSRFNFSYDKKNVFNQIF